MRLSDPLLLSAMSVAVNQTYLAHAPGGDHGRPVWVEILEVDVPDTHLTAIRFPGRIMLSPDPEEGQEKPFAATGVYVVMIDAKGDVVYSCHSAKGTL